MNIKDYKNAAVKLNDFHYLIERIHSKIWQDHLDRQPKRISSCKSGKCGIGAMPVRRYKK